MLAWQQETIEQKQFFKDNVIKIAKIEKIDTLEEEDEERND